MADPQNIRKSGKTTAEEVTKEECTEEKLTEPLGTVGMEVEPHRDRLVRPYFQRMRTEWNSDQKMVLQRVHHRVEKQIQEVFAEAFDIMIELYDVVRTRVVDVDADDVWEKTSSGAYREDWGKLTHKQRERFLFLITTRLFTWEQQAAGLNFEAVFAKAEWEQSFATGYESLPGTRPTIEDRTSRARLTSQDDYYFALMRTYFSRRADAVVRSMSGLAQRLKDVHTV
jgi:hypothetical protein